MMMSGMMPNMEEFGGAPIEVTKMQSDLMEAFKKESFVFMDSSFI